MNERESIEKKKKKKKRLCQTLREKEEGKNDAFSRLTSAGRTSSVQRCGMLFFNRHADPGNAMRYPKNRQQRKKSGGWSYRSQTSDLMLFVERERGTGQEEEAY